MRKRKDIKIRKCKQRTISKVKDAIAYRTRLRLGSVMKKTKPDQHPHNWPLLKIMEEEKARLKILKSRTPAKVNRGYRLINSSGRFCKQANSVKDRCRRALNQKRKKRRANARKPYLRSSQIQVVTISNVQSRKRTRRRRKGRSQNRRNKRARRSNKKRGNGKRTRKKRKPIKRITTHRRVVHRCLCHNKRRERYSRSKKRKFNYEFNFLDDYDFAFGPQDKVISDNLDSGVDEFKDDPLNVNDLCRSLVKSMPENPADNRNISSIKKYETPKVRKYDKKTVIRKTLKFKPEKSKNKSTNMKPAKRRSRICRANRVTNVCNTRIHIQNMAHRRRITKDSKVARKVINKVKYKVDRRYRKHKHNAATVKNKSRLCQRITNPYNARYCYRHLMGVKRSAEVSKQLRRKI